MKSSQLTDAILRATNDLKNSVAERSEISTGMHLARDPAREVQRYEHACRVWLRITELRHLAVLLDVRPQASDALLSAKGTQETAWRLRLSDAALRIGMKQHEERVHWWTRFAGLIDPELVPEFIEHLLRRDHLADYEMLRIWTGDPYFDLGNSAEQQIREADIRYLRAVRQRKDTVVGFTAEAEKFMVRVPWRWWWYAEEIGSGTFIGPLPDEGSPRS